MKEYKVEGRPVNTNAWWSIGNFFNNIEEAEKRIKQEKSYDEFNTKTLWEYRILVREVSNWEVHNG